jgi:hypothetical protein
MRQTAAGKPGTTLYKPKEAEESVPAFSHIEQVYLSAVPVRVLLKKYGALVAPVRVTVSAVNVPLGA